MQLIEVKDKKDARRFLYMAIDLYKNEKNWIRPLDVDVENVFDPKKNKYFRNGGQCSRWILVDDKGKTIGRIAAFFSPKTAKKDNDQLTGGVGLFECINDYGAASMLFDRAKLWLEERDMEAMDGPINFGDRDQWWGLLVDGFDREPNYRCNYNPPYYQELFEKYGFQTYFKQLTFCRKTLDPLHEKLQIKADIIAKDPKYSFDYLRLKNLDRYVEEFRTVYNQAWAGHKGVPKMTAAQAKHVIYQLKPIIDERIVWFGYYDGEPIAFFISLPEVNQIFKYVNGKMNLLGKLKFVYHKWRKSCKKMFGLVFGVVPDHQKKGVEGALIMAARKMVQEDYYRYEDYEMNWIGDFNPKMIRVVEQVGGYVGKTHITYRKLFDESKPFKRHPIKD